MSDIVRANEVASALDWMDGLDGVYGHSKLDADWG
jgi:hypothetical protein